MTFGHTYKTGRPLTNAEINQAGANLEEMQDIVKESFCFDIYNQLQDEFGMIDPDGKLVRQIQDATGKTLQFILESLQSELLRNMKPEPMFITQVLGPQTDPNVPGF